MKIAIIALSFLAVLLVGVLVTGIWANNTYNQAVTLKVAYESKIKANSASFDNMKKQIKQMAEVSTVQYEKLKDIFNSYAEARSGGQEQKGAIMNWVQESVPNVSDTTMLNIQNVITATQNGWTRNQIELVAISQDYNTLLQTSPSNLLLNMFNFESIDPKVITSAKTKEAFETGEDNDYSVFPN